MVDYQLLDHITVQMAILHALALVLLLVLHQWYLNVLLLPLLHNALTGLLSRFLLIPHHPHSMVTSET